jgi:magnesium chelatase subunit H
MRWSSRRWSSGASGRGLTPVEATIMVAIPELDGATGPTVFGGRSGSAGRNARAATAHATSAAPPGARDMNACAERTEMLAAGSARLVRLRKAKRGRARIAITLFNFPPNAGAAGTAANLSVFESLSQRCSRR